MNGWHALDLGDLLVAQVTLDAIRAAVAARSGALPSPAPGRWGLELLAGPDSSWALLPR